MGEFFDKVSLDLFGGQLDFLIQLILPKFNNFFNQNFKINQFGFKFSLNACTKIGKVFFDCINGDDSLLTLITYLSKFKKLYNYLKLLVKLGVMRF